MKFLLLIAFPTICMMALNIYFEDITQKEILNTFTGIIIGSLISFYATSTFEGLKYRINEKNNYLNHASKIDLILNNNLKNLIHNQGALFHFEENLKEPALQELNLYSFNVDSDSFLMIGNIDILQKKSLSFLQFENIESNLNILKNYHLKFLPQLESAIAKGNLDQLKLIHTEFVARTASLRIIIKDNIHSAYEHTIETISLLQANSKRVGLSRSEKFIFGNLTSIYVKKLDENYLQIRKNKLKETFKLK